MAFQEEAEEEEKQREPTQAIFISFESIYSQETASGKFSLLNISQSALFPRQFWGDTRSI